MAKIHFYRQAESPYPACKVDKRVASTDPNRNTEISETTCVACVKQMAYYWKNEEAQERHLELI